jgi:hypothetical protein
MAHKHRRTGRLCAATGVLAAYTWRIKKSSRKLYFRVCHDWDDWNNLTHYWSERLWL